MGPAAGWSDHLESEQRRLGHTVSTLRPCAANGAGVPIEQAAAVFVHG